MKKIVLALTFLCSTIFAGTINIAVAANVSYAINDLIAEFNKTNPDTKVEVVLGSSGKFTTQIQNGAPFDIFMSADMKFPETLEKENLTSTKPVIYAQGSLAMLSIKPLDFSKGIALVANKSIEKIAIANPKTAPYGTAAIKALKNANLLEKIENKFVYAESISQAVTYAITAADVGFIAKSSLYDEKMSKYKENINWISVDPKLYTPIDQGIVVLKKAQNNKEAHAFYNFILSKEAKDIFLKFGYLVK
ncbi:molybdate ABC transporter substrate-binding protein [Aliarcobacter cryaerophilus ATCC 43158]|uniref:Molybdenum ABC transporter ModABC, periplasmic molybdate-binding protein n=1 Tax=Aliarcobacter cryaerophilus ATCC 43158 TaxID=1032070 RepID=A0AAD0TS79_9BACT|nr:molybdate ABC transporter substrate-binding protein [Aliarcobacter cryaerophilus]AYJ79190.1 molybdenum ABC transporter ModABC, periplasmic molybdate-binding protein [Aliarcobacter cryaerophilus ATCC 43158]PRM94698.1 molybdate ABC transporter substrate-binding protein [Aliarcobacter cryaerophilus]QCZ23455.1 molybdate ABC transporter substrate-binding protein [Aliarcobacter cryaerophilus ATCC 43158]